MVCFNGIALSHMLTFTCYWRNLLLDYGKSMSLLEQSSCLGIIIILDYQDKKYNGLVELGP